MTQQSSASADVVVVVAVVVVVVVVVAVVAPVPAPVVVSPCRQRTAASWSETPCRLLTSLTHTVTVLLPHCQPRTRTLDTHTHRRTSLTHTVTTWPPHWSATHTHRRTCPGGSCCGAAVNQ